MCGLIEWLGWYELSIPQQWEYGIKLLGVLGAIFVFWWTISRWFLTKKIEFEISILNSIKIRRIEMGELREKIKQAHKTGNLPTEIPPPPKRFGLESGWKEAVMTGVLKTVDGIIRDVEESERLVVNKKLRFRKLRQLNKQYSGTLHLDLVDYATEAGNAVSQKLTAKAKQE